VTGLIDVAIAETVEIEAVPLRAKRGKGARRAGLFVARALTALVLLGLWEYAATYWVNPFWLAKPSAIAVRLWTMAGSGDLWLHGKATISYALIGLLASVVVGVPIGLMFGANRFVAETIEPFFLGLYSLPRVALAPLFILWLGIGDLSKIVMSFSMVLFLVVLNTYEGVRAVDTELVDMLRVMRASTFYIARRVTLPAIVPWVFASVRAGVGLALIGAVLGEFLGANIGLGWYVEHSAGRLDVVGVFSGLSSLLIVGIILNELARALEARFLRHRP
jgi:NitT/TauT family transport system permease protein